VSGGRLDGEIEARVATGLPVAGRASAVSRLPASSSHGPSGWAPWSNWRHSLWGKLAAFMLLGFVLAYAIAATVGMVMLDRSLREQWWHQAGMNAQIVSAAIRRIYTFVAVETDGNGQVVRIISERALGDPASILDTGFSPVDVLALASAQTGENVWLLGPELVDGRLLSRADAWGSSSTALVSLQDEHELSAQGLGHFYVGFAQIGEQEHFVSVLPVTTADGVITGSVVTSIGLKSELYATRNAPVRGLLLMLVLVLLVASCTIIFVMRQIFRPVPKLIESIARLARNETSMPTPFREREDEIGFLASAIEKLREAVIERENLRDIKEAALKLEYMAHHDALTGLPNRALLNRMLSEAVVLLSQGRRINVMLFDLDHFKEVNDNHGHAMGDALLASLGARVTPLLGDSDFLARMGGDEFALIQRVERDPHLEGSRLAARLVLALQRPFDIQGQELRIGTSVGIACAPEHGEAVSDLLRCADVALYSAKYNGRGTHVFYAYGMAMLGKRADSD
jgi:diguanylate cyclase (GGDEF)-like protein